ncbi:hypothetical protein OHT57_44915 [Streptomyces sp. NBC_00285]|uniref:hypothetical protein n=1 Tax=Streptomyces sp. NBC_00285 TaxID=2975700 RepID=UPI002E2C404B|nr:hypothetical protein [Streptomyces sp. NBC_00285]
MRDFGRSVPPADLHSRPRQLPLLVDVMVIAIDEDWRLGRATCTDLISGRAELR